MGGLDVMFQTWREVTDMPTKGYSVQRNLDDFVPPLRDRLDSLYEELQAYLETDPEAEEYSAEIAELRGKCWALAYAVGSFIKPDDPEDGLSQVRQSTHAKWAANQ